MNRAKFPPAEISSPSPSDSVSFMPMSGAFCSMASMPKPKPPSASGLVSLNSTDSETEWVEKTDAGEEAIEGMPVSPGACRPVLAAPDMASGAGAVLGNVRMIDMASGAGAVMGNVGM